MTLNNSVWLTFTTMKRFMKRVSVLFVGIKRKCWKKEEYSQYGNTLAFVSVYVSITRPYQYHGVSDE